MKLTPSIRGPVIVVSLCLLTVLGYVYVLPLFSQEVANARSTLSTQKTIDTSEHDDGDNAISNHWQWDAFSQSKAVDQKTVPDSVQESPLDIIAIFDALKKVELNDNGGLVVDQKALSSLQRTFRNLGEETSLETVQQLQELIKMGLPGGAGKETAKIFGDYYQYLEAKNLLDNRNEIKSESQDSRQYLENLVDLRREHLGNDTAAQLYSAQEAHQRFVLENHEINKNQQLSQSEKGEKRAQLKRALQSGLLNIDSRGTDAVENMMQASVQWGEQGLADETQAYLQKQTLGLVAARRLAKNDSQRLEWQQRYSSFESQRAEVINAGLSEQDKQQQIEQLLAEHFSEKEIQVSGNYLPASATGDEGG